MNYYKALPNWSTGLIIFRIIRSSFWLIIDNGNIVISIAIALIYDLLRWRYNEIFQYFKIFGIQLLLKIFLWSMCLKYSRLYLEEIWIPNRESIVYSKYIYYLPFSEWFSARKLWHFSNRLFSLLRNVCIDRG